MVVEVQSEQESTVTWYKNEIQLIPNDRFDMTREDTYTMLVIVNARPEDSGEYVCEAENLSGKTVCRTTLTVNRKSI